MERKDEIVPQIPPYKHDELGYYVIVLGKKVVRPVDVVDGNLVVLNAKLVEQRKKQRGTINPLG